MTVGCSSGVDFEFLICSLPGVCQAGLPIAAARAGAVGVLNLQFCDNPLVARQEAGRLARLGRGQFGLLLDGEPTEAALAALESGAEPYLVLLCGAPATPLAEMVERARRVARRVGLVVSGAAEIELARGLNLDLVVAKGHEAGGCVGDETTFVLLQRLREFPLPVYAWGGVGLCSVAACLAGGAAGVLLDWQFALFPEAGLPGGLVRRIARFDGTETAVLAAPERGSLRYFAPRESHRTGELTELARKLAQEPAVPDGIWNATLRKLLAEPRDDQGLWLVGQDAAFAASFAEVSTTVGRVVDALRHRARQAVLEAARSQALAPQGPLARSQGTTYPILQGPMTRVSDVAGFCHAVARGGALPFLALSLMREEAASSLLDQTRHLLGDLPWGVGILGFAPRERREEQLRVIERARPPFAIIAGGRPDQAAAFERLGIATYLHVPSPAMLAVFVEEGARRFIFEGGECGGHVGPRSSFILWDAAVRTLAQANLPPDQWERLHVVFAGGIHDAQSCAMVAALAQPLVERGAKIGVLMGTAYLFTRELVETGATVSGFQQVMLETARTRLIETGPGHAIRVAETPFVDDFERRKSQLLREGRPGDEVREALELLNLGRLRIASKGIARQAAAPGQTPFLRVAEAQQRREGMYMAGQVATLRRECLSIAELHEEVSGGCRRWLHDRFGGQPGATEVAPARVEVQTAPPPPASLDVAIIGMSCLLPGCTSLEAFWRRVVRGDDLITEVPDWRFNAGLWFDPDRGARDRIFSKWGGFLEEIPFDPTRYGIPPRAVGSIEPGQLLALLLVEQALADAGYLEENPYHQRTSVLFGASGGVADLAQKMIFRSLIPQYLPQADSAVWGNLPEWTEDSFAGLLPNVVSGRVSNRFDLGGMNATIDAACASSLAAVDLACRGLADGSADMAIAGGIDLVQGPFAYLCFSKTGALSPRGRSRAFDESADGIAISEGLAAIILKRRADAERDGDRIYAVIKGVGAGSDGRQRGLTAPSLEGQLRALTRAYAQARVDPRTVALIEAHGTGTPVGDAVECQALAALLHKAEPRSVALGSAKSQFGHVKSAAGMVGLIKAALSLYYRVLPPTLHVNTPNPKAGLQDGPLYVNSELRPWIGHEHPRRAGVSAFGFGGTNYHALLEEYRDQPMPASARMARAAWPAELFLLEGASPQELLAQARALQQACADERFADETGLARLAAEHFRSRGPRPGGLRAAIVAGSRDELHARLLRLHELLAASTAAATSCDPQGVYVSAQPVARCAPVAFLYAGQGAQFPNMMRDLAIEFSEVDEALSAADGVLRDLLGGRLSARIYPPPPFTQAEQNAAVEALKATNVAQPALGACAVAATNILRELGVRPDMTAGHSYGELPALWAAGVFDEATLYALSYRRGAAMLACQSAAARDLGTMLAVSATPEQVEPLLAGRQRVWIANINSPRQLTLTGESAAVQELAAALDGAGLAWTRLPVPCAFHSPLVAAAQEGFGKVLEAATISPPRLCVFGNLTAAEFPADVAAIRELLAAQIVSRVRFAEQLLAMYRRGARLFIEVGPSELLARFVSETLSGRPHAVASIQSRSRNGLAQLLHALALSWVHGVDVDLSRIHDARSAGAARRRATAIETARESPRAWRVSGACARPPGDGQPRVLPQPAAAGAAPNPAPPPAERPVPGPQLAQLGPRHAEAPELIEQQSMPGQPQDVSPSPKPSPGDNLEIYREFQQTMRQFLETQKSVFEMFLGERDSQAAPREPDDEAPSQPARTPPAAGEPRERPDLPKAAVQETTRLAPEAARPATAAAAPEELLISLVSERTGYPKDMVLPGARLEADLGIDSIKRVEIVTEFRKQALPHLPAAPSWFMEEVAAAPTLQDILVSFQRLASEVGAPGAALSPAASPGASSAPTNGHALPRTAGLARFEIECIELPAAGKEYSMPAGAWILTDDGLGTAAGLAACLEARGAQSFIVGADALATAQKTAARVQLARETCGRIAGFIHLVPGRPADAAAAEDPALFREHCQTELLGLLHLLQATSADLASPPGCAACVVSTGGGDFGERDELAGRFPWRAGLAGMLKTARHEFPAARFRLLDVDRIPEPPALLADLLAEGPVEVGRRAGRRLALKTVQAVAPSGEGPPAPTPGIDSSSVILVTGGARGITSQVVMELARQTRAHLVIVGRTPAAPGDGLAELAGLGEPELYARARDLLARRVNNPTPAQVRQEVDRYLKAREVERSLDNLRQTGATVEYHACDLRDTEAFSRLVKGVVARMGRVDGLVHGAGIIEDRAIADKSDESFARVIDTKVLPVLALSQLVPLQQLKFAMFFASVAGFHGNAGQVDYAAANEILNRLARRWRNLGAGKVVAINWGPWSGGGMVAPHLARELESRGMRLVLPAEGSAAAWRELAGPAACCRVILGDGPWRAGEPASEHGGDPRPLRAATLPRTAAPAPEPAA